MHVIQLSRDVQAAVILSLDHLLLTALDPPDPDRPTMIGAMSTIPVYGYDMRSFIVFRRADGAFRLKLFRVGPVLSDEERLARELDEERAERDLAWVREWSMNFGNFIGDIF